MRCPNKQCRKETGRLVIRFDDQGRKREGCPSCMSSGGTVNVRTGRKIWAGSQVYTPAQLEQKNHDWFERTANRAAEMRRRSPLRDGKGRRIG